MNAQNCQFVQLLQNFFSFAGWRRRMPDFLRTCRTYKTIGHPVRIEKDHTKNYNERIQDSRVKIENSSFSLVQHVDYTSTYHLRTTYAVRPRESWKDAFYQFSNKDRYCDRNTHHTYTIHILTYMSLVYVIRRYVRRTYEQSTILFIYVGNKFRHLKNSYSYYGNSSDDNNNNNNTRFQCGNN